MQHTGSCFNVSVLMEISFEQGWSVGAGTSGFLWFRYTQSTVSAPKNIRLNFETVLFDIETLQFFQLQLRLKNKFTKVFAASIARAIIYQTTQHNNPEVGLECMSTNRLMRQICVHFFSFNIICIFRI